MLFGELEMKIPRTIHKVFRAGALGLAWALLLVADGRSGTPAEEHPGSVWVTQLIDRHLEAIGGKALVQRITSGEVSLLGQQGAYPFAMRLRYRADGKLAFDIARPRGPGVHQVRDTNGLWWQYDAGRYADIKSEKERLVLWAMTIGLDPTSWFRINETFNDYRYGGRETLGDRDVNVLKAATPRGGVATLYFEVTTGLLIRVDDTTLGEYREFGGVKLPRKIRQGPDFLLEANANLFNRPLGDNLFDKPPLAGSLIEKAELAHVLYQTAQREGGLLGIVRAPAPLPLIRMPLLEWPKTGAVPPFHMDLCGLDLSGLDLRPQGAGLRQADFDSKTIWPGNLPPEFEPARIMEIARNPGLGLRRLHTQGLTGKGVGIALIDQPLLVDHQEYRDRLRLYEEIHVRKDCPATVPGCAAASIAAGKTTGVAPEADLYYLALTPNSSREEEVADTDLTWIARAIERILEVNQRLPNAAKIRVIGISAGRNPNLAGHVEYQRAVAKAKAVRVLVLAPEFESVPGLAFQGLGRKILADPDLPASYGPGSRWEKSFVDGSQRFAPGQRLLVPMDARAVASPAGTNDYVFHPQGAATEPIPYLAGLYALACQAKPDLSPEGFVAHALQTGNTVEVTDDPNKLMLGTIANPAALVEVLTRK